MKTFNIKCKAFSGEKVKINKIHVGDDKVVRVWDSVAGHYTSCHSLTSRSIGKIQRLLQENNHLEPINQ
tara:strand:+ start:418 stop:624 length:207 start_codon:yes stop_codon:yes gene_type:complete